MDNTDKVAFDGFYHDLTCLVEERIRDKNYQFNMVDTEDYNIHAYAEWVQTWIEVNMGGSCKNMSCEEWKRTKMSRVDHVTNKMTWHVYFVRNNVDKVVFMYFYIAEMLNFN